MSKPGTFAFLLRWNFVPFACGVLLAVLAGYGLRTYEPVKPPPSLAGHMTAGVDLIGLPVLFWVGLIVGLVIAGRALLKTHSMAHP